MKSKKRFVRCCVFAGIILAIMLVFAPAYRSVLACEPTAVIPGYTPPTPIPLETQVAGVSQMSEIILDGTIKSWVDSSNGNSILTVEVERYLKGHGPKTVKISGYFWECAPNFAFSEGSRSIFFVNGNPASTEPLQVRSWFDAQATVVASVKNSTGQEPMAPDSTYDVVWLSLLGIIILGLIVFMRYHRARS